MNPDEAYQILNIEKGTLNLDTIEKTYKKLYDINDPSKGGSFYLQSKIYRAKEALLEEINKSNDNQDAKAKNSDKNNPE